jgi:hypothetical protein
MPAHVILMRNIMNRKQGIIAGAVGLAVAGTVAVAGAYTTQADTRGFGPNYSPERHEQTEKALESNDYGAWKELMGGRGAARVVTAETFPRFAEMHRLREEGKDAEADKIREELGLGAGRGEGRGRHGGFVDGNKDGTCDRRQ